MSTLRQQHPNVRPGVIAYVSAMTKRGKRIAFLRREITLQRQWIEEHGGSLTGYIERYGSKRDAEHYGEGGEAIYAADRGHLERLQDELRDIEGGY